MLSKSTRDIELVITINAQLVRFPNPIFDVGNLAGFNLVRFPNPH